MTFSQEFKGNLKSGIVEIKAERQKIKEEEEKADRQKAERMREIMRGPKF
ncbi:hypothetical protein [Chryseobacterium sp.]|jgi:hypothetical protein|nr:hypothetical protein [Chryseobacterium sp.]MDR3025153.1 hypothetical protein [Chryseobacterium sp.]